jgi:hypothetical protein
MWINSSTDSDFGIPFGSVKYEVEQYWRRAGRCRASRVQSDQGDPYELGHLVGPVQYV